MLQFIDKENEDTDDIIKNNVDKLEEEEQPKFKRRENRLVTSKFLRNKIEQVSEHEPLSKKLDNPNENEDEDEDDEDENLLEKPGNIHHAIVHSNAMKILDIPKIFEKNKKVNFCPDCYLPEETEGIVKKYNYCVDTKALTRNGIGLYFFFFFHKILIFNLIGLFSIAGVPYLFLNKKYTNKLLDYCKKYYIEDNSTPISFPYTNNELCMHLKNFTKINIINEFTGESMYIYKEIMKELLGQDYVDKILINYQFIAFICLITLFVANLLFIIISQTQLKEINYGNINISEYTLLISDLNEDEYEKMTDEDNTKPLEFINEDVDITQSQINFTYKLSEIYKLKQQIKDLKKYKIEYKDKETFTTGPFYNRVTHRTIDIPSEIKEIKEKIKSLEENNKNNFTGVVFVTFNNVEELKAFKKHFPNTFIQKIFKSLKNYCLLRCCKCCINDMRAKQLRSYLNLTVFRPPEPEDIIFENLEYSFCYRFTKSVINYLLVILLLGISFGTCLLFNFIQSKCEKEYENKKVLNYGISICISLVTSIINYFIKRAFNNSTDNEKMWSHTDKYLSLSVKISIFTFFNSAIVPLLTSYILFGWDSHENLVNNVFVIFLCSSLLGPLISLTCYDLFLNKLMRWWYVTRKYEDEYEYIEEYSQGELNKLFEQPSMRVSMQYSYLVQQFCMAFFYAALFPFGVVLVVIGVILDYFIEKFKIIYIYKKPEMINETICIFYIDYFIFSLFFFGLGNYVFFSPTHSNRTYEFFNCIFFICILLFPYNYILRKINFLEKYKGQIPYDLAYFSFSFDYERMNPRTQKQGVINYLTKLCDHKYINEKTLENSKKCLDDINLMEFFYFSKITKDNTPIKKLGKYRAFINKLKKNSIINKVITKEQEKQKKNKKEKEQQIIKKDIENCYEYTCYQTNRFFNNFGLFIKNKALKNEVIKNKNTLKNQKTINKDKNKHVDEIKFTSDDLLNRNENLNYISSGFADNYHNSVKMQIDNLNNLKTIIEQKDDININKNFFKKNNENKENNKQNNNNIFVFNYDNPSDLQNVNVNNNNLNYINIYNSIININQNTENNNNNNSYNNLNKNNDNINISYNNDKCNANNNIFNTIFGKNNTQADSHHFKNFNSNDII